MTTPYYSARRAEYTAIEDLTTNGYEAQRTAGSHSPFDIIAWKETELRLIQVKRVQHAWQISHAVNEAIAAWQNHHVPAVKNVAIDLWIRHTPEWHKYDLRLLSTLPPPRQIAHPD